MILYFDFFFNDREMEPKAKRQRVLYSACDQKRADVDKQKAIIADAKDAIKMLRKDISACQKDEKKKAKPVKDA